MVPAYGCGRYHAQASQPRASVGVTVSSIRSARRATPCSRTFDLVCSLDAEDRVAGEVARRRASQCEHSSGDPLAAGVPPLVDRGVDDREQLNLFALVEQPASDFKREQAAEGMADQRIGAGGLEGADRAQAAFGHLGDAGGGLESRLDRVGEDAVHRAARRYPRRERAQVEDLAVPPRE